MATILKPVRLVNPGKKKRRLTARQKLFFGSKRQRAAVQKSMHNPRGTNRKYRKAVKSRNYAKAMHYNKSQTARTAERKRKSVRSRSNQHYDNTVFNKPSRIPNVGEIITIRPLTNSGYKAKGTFRKRRKLNNMAKSRKRVLAGKKAARTRRRKAAMRSSHRRRNPGTRRRNTSVARVHHRRRRRNPTSVVTRTRYIRRNSGRRRHSRRNPGIMSGSSGLGKAVGVIAGALVTSVASGFLPSAVATGIPSYIAIGLIAMLQGKAAGKILKNPSLGNDMTTGGYVYLALRIAKDYLPSLNLGVGISGLGLIGGSSFYVPQVNQPGSMGNFQVPAAVMGAIPVSGGMKGLGTGTSMRRMGRLR